MQPLVMELKLAQASKQATRLQGCLVSSWARAAAERVFCRAPGTRRTSLQSAECTMVSPGHQNGQHLATFGDIHKPGLAGLVRRDGTAMAARPDNAKLLLDLPHIQADEISSAAELRH